MGIKEAFVFSRHENRFPSMPKVRLRYRHVRIQNLQETQITLLQLRPQDLASMAKFQWKNAGELMVEPLILKNTGKSKIDHLIFFGVFG